MIETAENLARDYEITREEADAFAARSHQRAAAAWDEGKFDDEVVPVAVPQKKGETVDVRRATKACAPTPRCRALAKLKPIVKDGVVTAGNASQQNDAAAACLVVAEDKLAELGLEPMAFLVGWAAAGCEPSRMGIGPVPAVASCSSAPACGLDEIDLVELNEAFAARCSRCCKGWGCSLDEPRPAERQRLGHLARPPDRAPPACASWPRCCTSCSGARRATAWRPCASAAARASRRSSSGLMSMLAPQQSISKEFR